MLHIAAKAAQLSCLEEVMTDDIKRATDKVGWCHKRKRGKRMYNSIPGSCPGMLHLIIQLVLEHLAFNHKIWVMQSGHTVVSRVSARGCLPCVNIEVGGAYCSAYSCART